MTAPLPWLGPHDPFPPPAQSWGDETPAPGLLATGGTLDVPHLLQAYAQGIFPWFGEGQPPLWWSPDPRMVLHVPEFRLHHSLRRVLRRFSTTPGCEVRIDSNFSAVIDACAHTPRVGQPGTWIVPAMVEAYEALHAAGHAHSVETWVNGRLVGGLYCVALGRAVFGESMFTHATDASKIALAALVCLCRREGVELIDCQQNTRHLASLGAREVSRTQFLQHVERAAAQPACRWTFEPLYWNALLSTPHAA
ncbi:leucyl/phenylalanyl-tRNA--protein transferase [Diaphorobacter sp.]|uniref:leucyl/phenylalanyl-tRNA--protein transferase n=1 Tax=Diaphorobacter sp. TaxID=1934310 RepID=UPI003D10E5B3